MEVAYFDLVDALDDDAGVRAVVLTGAGRGFCPGLDAADLADRTHGVAGPGGCRPADDVRRGVPQAVASPPSTVGARGSD